VKLFSNKKGQIGSVILAVVLLFVIAIIFFFSSHVFGQLYGSLNDQLKANPDYNNSVAQQAIAGIEEVEQSIWDYAILAVVFGIVIQLIIFSFATRTSPVFYWLFMLVGLVILVVGAVLSNIWQTIAEKPEFATTVLQFPMTDAILGNGFVLFIISTILLISIIVLFGKGGEEGGP